MIRSFNAYDLSREVTTTTSPDYCYFVGASGKDEAGSSITFEGSKNFVLVLPDTFGALDEYSNYRIINFYIQELNDDFDIYYVERYITNYESKHNAYKFYIHYKGEGGTIPVSDIQFKLEPME